MKAIYLDCFAGISGNMLLGAFIGAGVPVAHLEKELSRLPIAGEFALNVSDVNKNGIAAVYVDVQLTGENEHSHAQTHSHSEVHTHAHSHVEIHTEVHTHSYSEHQHRTMRDIRGIIEGSTLATAVKQMSLAIFEEIAVAEGKVHGKAADEVSFHEVGAVDSIVDIVGTAICLDYLGIERVYASRLNLGSGFVHCAHGLMPVPAPAVAELTRGWECVQQHAECELTTPTGAGVVRALATYSQSLPPELTAERIAYGAGTRDLAIPNVLRLYIGELGARPESDGEAARDEASKNLVILETNIDDMSSQILGYLYERLLAAGARDVWSTPIYMKKNRPAYQLSVLVAREKQADCARIIFRETTSIGLRVIAVAERLEAARHIASVDTTYGKVRLKVSAWQGELVNVSAEYDDCRELAAKNNVPLKQIQQAALKEFNDRLGE